MTKELPFKAGTAKISQHIHIETATSQISIVIQVKTDKMGALTENTCNMEPENTEQLHYRTIRYNKQLDMYTQHRPICFQSLETETVDDKIIEGTYNLYVEMQIEFRQRLKCSKLSL